MENLKLIEEINSFQTLWKGGYRTGYSTKRNQRGIEDYLKQNVHGKCCLEIGCGGGQWSRFLYDLNVFEKIYCIDVLSAEHNNFWEYVGEDKKDKIEYFQINNFCLDILPENSLDYVFSYDVFCHISYSGIEAFLKNLYGKCKKDCNLLIMYADPKKYLLSEPENILSLQSTVWHAGLEYKTEEDLIINCLNDKDGVPMAGRWYWVGIENFIDLCKKYNYKILDRDLKIDKTNPITLFLK